MKAGLTAFSLSVFGLVCEPLETITETAKSQTHQRRLKPDLLIIDDTEYRQPSFVNEIILGLRLFTSAIF